jgi:tRNA U34 5-carboxymethylaminomethyl modifying GTPase MnmE/TrmE
MSYQSQIRRWKQKHKDSPLMMSELNKMQKTLRGIVYESDYQEVIKPMFKRFCSMEKGE